MDRWIGPFVSSWRTLGRVLKGSQQETSHVVLRLLGGGGGHSGKPPLMAFQENSARLVHPSLPGIHIGSQPVSLAPFWDSNKRTPTGLGTTISMRNLREKKKKNARLAFERILPRGNLHRKVFNRKISRKASKIATHGVLSLGKTPSACVCQKWRANRRESHSNPEKSVVTWNPKELVVFCWGGGAMRLTS